MLQVFNQNVKKIPLLVSNQFAKIIKSFLYLFIFFTWAIIILGTFQNFI